MEPATNKSNDSGSLFLAQNQSDGKLQLVVFHVDGEEYGLDVLRVHEIIRLPHLTRVPDSGGAVDRVMNLRGKIVPVVSLRRCFGLKAVPDDQQTRIIVVETNEGVIGFIVDSVSEVFHIAAESVEDPPRLGKVNREYVSGVSKIDDRFLILLDVDRLMKDDHGLAVMVTAQGEN